MSTRSSQRPSSDRPPSTSSASLDLVCLLGFTGKFPGTLHHHPSVPSVILYPIGSSVVICDTTDPHNQQFLHTHTQTQSTDHFHEEDISLMEISPSGRLLATAQLASSHQKGLSTVSVWDLKGKQLLFQLRGHSSRVRGLSFSHDDAFLATIGSERLYLWSIDENGEYAGGLTLRGPGCFVNFSPPSAPTTRGQAHARDFDSRRPVYGFVYGDSKVRKGTWKYEVRQMQFRLGVDEFKLPGRISGLRRTYLCCVVAGPEWNLVAEEEVGGGAAGCERCFVGTRLGEVIVFNNTYATFETSLLVASNGVHSIALLKLLSGTGRAAVIVGGGDGSIKILQHTGREWTIVRETKVAGMVTSLSIPPPPPPIQTRVQVQSTSTSTSTSLFAGTDNGKMLEVSVPDLRLVGLPSEGHVDGITAVAFSPTSDIFCAASKDGSISVWNTDTYRMVCDFRAPGKATCLNYASVSLSSASWGSSPLSTMVLSGWSDGFLRCFDTRTRELSWKIVNAHQGPITCVVFNDVFICSAGEDSAIRVWRTRTRELVAQFSDHSKTVTGLALDVSEPSLLHSCSIDKGVHVYDLKTSRRISYHTLSRDGLLCLSQKIDGEMESVTGSTTGILELWDIDFKAAVKSVRIPVVFPGETEPVALGSIRCVDVSPRTGQFVAMGGERGVLVIYHFASERVVDLGIAHSSSIACLKWSHDERQIVVVGDDASISVWNVYHE